MDDFETHLGNSEMRFGRSRNELHEIEARLQQTTKGIDRLRDMIDAWDPEFDRLRASIVSTLSSIRIGAPINTMMQSRQFDEGLFWTDSATPSNPAVSTSISSVGVDPIRQIFGFCANATFLRDALIP